MPLEEEMATMMRSVGVKPRIRLDGSLSRLICSFRDCSTVSSRDAHRTTGCCVWDCKNHLGVKDDSPNVYFTSCSLSLKGNPVLRSNSTVL